ncbi:MULTISPECIES: GreA/GreB family elongation factor [Streptomyces]|uniref:Nucleoside diphosphate kinase regulator n=1 Tax=Streptomyces griseus TaxID=1911 RepID=A0A380P6R3_STRGR|nr:GreA/GreB family elongation factor [Streptomyces griseus]WSU34593.1 GreA/GreB family elongation factor [Streptomyces gougerotii]SUP60514.1 Nucleoside diphosphate kinase regulator [Streptomyces griseus]
MTSDSLPISAAARHALERELAGVRTERETVAATLGDTDVVGDRADDADELRRSADLARLDARITEITTRLRQADDAGPPPVGVVGVGSTVTVRFDDGTEQTVTLGEVTEGPDTSLVTAESPLGRALRGRRPGDAVRYRTPDGEAAATVVSLGEAPPA